MTIKPDSSELDLIRACQAQNRLAQQYLYQRFYSKMLGICMRYTSHQDEAIDVLNRAFLKVFRSIDQYQPTGQFAGWVAKIVFNTAIDFVRQQANYRQTINFPEVLHDISDAEPLEHWLADDIFQFIQELPPHTRAVFSLYYVEGYKHREIADLLNININTCKWHLASAKKMLQDALMKKQAIHSKI